MGEVIVSIFVEYVIVDNIVMNYIILRLMELTIGIRFKRICKVVVCVIGSALALIMPIIMQYKIIVFLYKIFSSIIMVLCIKKHKKIKGFLVYYLMFFAYTFFVGGVCFGLIQLLGIDYTMSSVVMYEFDFPFGVFGIILILILKVMSKVIGVVKSKISTSNFIKKISLTTESNTLQVVGFIDTGNKVNYNGDGVSIISINAFLRLYKDIELSDILIGNTMSDKIKSIEYIDISGIGVAKKYLSFVLDCIEFDGRKYLSQRFALTWKDLGEYEVVLHSKFLGGNYEKVNS